MKTREEVEEARRDRADREGRRLRLEHEPPRPRSEHGPPLGRGRRAVPRDFVLGATPWVDFSLTNFWIDNRVENFLNLGVQVGGYFFQRLRVTGRLVATLQETRDEKIGYSYASDGSGHFEFQSRSVSVLYGASLGLVITNSRSFVFGPGVLVMRTDVEDYGTSVALSAPFEWTTPRHLRIGFELALGQALGGTQAGDNGGTQARQPGTFVLLQFAMGVSLGRT